MKRHLSGVNLLLLGLSASLIAAACGARSGLEEGRSGPEPIEAGAGGGGGYADAGTGGAPNDAEPFNCEEAGVTFIYVMTAEEDLFRFYPPDLTFTLIGSISCAGAGGVTPYSMAVDRKGTGYVLFGDGQIYRVSTATASCEKTKFSTTQEGFNLFGMGFAANKDDPGEQLFVASHGGQIKRLATIDTKTMDLNVVGAFSSTVGNLELTGTGDGRLFGFGQVPLGAHFSEIDQSDAKVKSDIMVPLGQTISGYAFAFWGGDFYFFTSSGGKPSTVTRFRPEDGSFTSVATLNRIIVGAGVSTCAPQ